MRVLIFTVSLNEIYSYSQRTCIIVRLSMAISANKQ